MTVYKMRGGNLKVGFVDLCNYVHSKMGDSLSIIEIGVYTGEVTEILSNIFPNSKIFSIDIWEKYIESCSTYDLEKQGVELKEAEIIFDEKLKFLKNVTKCKTSSVEYSKLIEDHTIDFCYIDGNHQTSSVMEDIQHWLPKIKAGKIISGHDYHWPSVRKSVDLMFQKSPEKTFIDGSWLYTV
jgi:predicted O-methyltransferase YrrM